MKINISSMRIKLLICKYDIIDVSFVDATPESLIIKYFG